MKYAFLFLLAFTLLFTIFFLLLTRAALAELKFMWIERGEQRFKRRTGFNDFD